MRRRRRNPSSFQTELGYAYRTGQQDAANVMDVAQIADDLGPWPARTEIKQWVLDGVDINDMVDSWGIEHFTETEQRQIIEAWADGWADLAHAEMSKTLGRMRSARGQRSAAHAGPRRKAVLRRAMRRRNPSGQSPFGQTYTSPETDRFADYVFYLIKSTDHRPYTTRQVAKAVRGYLYDFPTYVRDQRLARLASRIADQVTAQANAWGIASKYIGRHLEHRLSSS